MTAPQPGDTFYVECRHCKGRRSVATGERNGEQCLFVENDCACPKPASALVVVACDMCGETGRHWLGCEFIGLPEMP